MNKQKILLVDDKEENLFSLERILTHLEGVENVKTTRPEEALRLCLDNEFSLAILDVQMPGMDGYELAELLRGNEKTEDMPIIFLSAMSVEDHHITKGYDIGGTDYIVKPVRAEVLIAKVRVFLELDASRRNLEQLVEERTSALVESEARFRGTFENASVGIAHVSPEGELLRVNQHLCDILDYTKEELEAKTFQEITLPEDLRRDQALFDRLKKGEIPTYSLEKRYSHRDGHVVWAHLTTAIQRDRNGRFDYCISLIRDITKRKEIERALEIERNRTVLMAEIAGLGVFDWDLETNQIYFSKIWKSQLGYDEHELEPHYSTFGSLLHPEDKDRISEALENAINTSKIWHGSFKLRHKDGSYRWIVAHGQIIEDEDGKKQRMIGAHLDMTEERAREESYRNAMEQAQASDLAKSQFLANMSHELRTPLNPIIGLSELLTDVGGEDPAEVVKLAEIIHQAGRHMLELVEEVLDLSRLQAGKAKLEMEMLDLSEPFLEAESILRAQAEAKNLAFNVELNLPEYKVYSSSKILRQITFNLLSNAIKFTDSGSVNLSAMVDREDDGVHRLTIRVEDTGLGIPEGKQKKIFEPFEQVDNSISRSHAGTGLGLAITQKHIEMLGGTIELESVENEGSRFIVKIPLELPSPMQEKVPSVTSSSGEIAEEESTKTGLRVMVVEDDLSNQLVIARMLALLNHVPFIFSDGQSAIDSLVSGESYDLILMDLKMPKMNGFDVTRFIRKETPCADIPIIAFTANVTEESKKECEASGMDGCLPKPLRMKDLEIFLNSFV